MPPKGYKKNLVPETKGAIPKTPAKTVEEFQQRVNAGGKVIAVESLDICIPKKECATCPYFVGPNGWGKCKVNPIPVDKFASDWCGQHPGRR